MSDIENAVVCYLERARHFLFTQFVTLNLMLFLTFGFANLSPLNLSASAASLPINPDQAIISFTFDDASNTLYQNGFPIIQNYGFTGTLFVPTNLVDQSTSGVDHGWLMNWEEVQELHNAGWEIGSHSRTHTRHTNLDLREIELELHGSILDIENKIGVRPNSFSSPFGDFNDATIEEVMKWYDYHLSWKGHLGRNPIDSVDTRYIGRMEVTNEKSSTLICGEMLRAAQTNTWLVLLFHGVVDKEPGEYQISTQKLDEILACAKSLSDNNIIQVKTVRDAMDTINNLN